MDTIKAEQSRPKACAEESEGRLEPMIYRTNTYAHAVREMDILLALANPKERPDIERYKHAILHVTELFGRSGQSGGSAPFMARQLSKVIEKLCLQEPISPILNVDGEWNDVDNDMFQNNRCSAIFKKGKDGKPYYLDALIFVGEDPGDQFTGKVEQYTSRQYIKSFPFVPKRFYIDVVREKYNYAKHRGKRVVECAGGKFVYKIKDLHQIVEALKYYDYNFE